MYVCIRYVSLMENGVFCLIPSQLVTKLLMSLIWPIQKVLTETRWPLNAASLDFGACLTIRYDTVTSLSG